MAVEIRIPGAGESVTEGVLAAWTVADGTWVDQDQTVCEIETDKITMELPAPAAGVVSHGAAEGDTVEIDQVIGSIDETASKPEGAASPAESKPAAAEAGGIGGAGGTAVAQPPVQSEPPTPAPATNGRPTSSNGSVSPRAAAPTGEVDATPLARKLAAEHGIDLTDVVGTGNHHKIREQDVLAFVQSQGHAPAVGGRLAGPSRETSLENMSPLRQKIASRLVEAQQTAAMLTTFNECDMTAVMALRKKYKEPFGEKHDIGLGFMGFFVKAAVKALVELPKINSYITENDKGRPAIRGHDYCDIAVAVSSPKGLVVPVVRSCETLSFAGIEKAIKDVAIKARDGKLSLEEMSGGTFTITNGGIFGSLLSTPILNPPQSAILGMHGIKKRAVEHPDRPGEVALRPMMYLAVSYDHRIVDGAEAVRFLVSIKESIEDPTRLLLDV
ncbi:MAG: 2-oxoglutarate dehydrogenase complex dihydrolipoyllysine-residue succinyltransferase [Planctomycetota bacterium]